MPVLSCCHRQPPPSHPGLLVLVGTHATPVAAHLRAQDHSLEHLSDAEADVPQLLDAAEAHLRRGRSVLLEVRPPALPAVAAALWDTATPLAAHDLARTCRALAAVLYVPVPELTRRGDPEGLVQGLISLGAHFAGSRARTPESIGFLHRRDLAAALAALRDLDPRGGAAAAALLRRFLWPVLGLAGPADEGVYLQPRPGLAALPSDGLGRAARDLQRRWQACRPPGPGAGLGGTLAALRPCPECPAVGSGPLPCPQCLHGVQGGLLGASDCLVAPPPPPPAAPGPAHYVVTGGAGFIGSHLVEHLLAEGHRVTVLDDLSTGKLSNLPQHERLTITIQDVSQWRLPEADPHGAPAFAGIFHLAAIPSVDLSWQEPQRAHRNNLTATLAVIAAAKAARIPRIVFASSAATYGNAASPVRESQAGNPISPYGLHKYVSEQYGRLFAGNGGAQFAACRFFNVYGPRQDPHSAYSGVLSLFANRARARRPITILGDGTQTRDFVYVKDVAKAVYLVMRSPMADPFMAMNVGTGRSIAIRDVADIIVGHAGVPLAIEFGPARVGDIKHSLADVSRLKAQVGWTPDTPLSRGTAALWRWLQEGAAKE